MHKNIHSILRTTLVALFIAPVFSSFAHSQIQPISDLPDHPGSGLDARVWKREGIQLTGLSKEVLRNISSKPAHATFTATTLNYAGNDLLSLEHWLKEDSTRLVFSDKSDAFNMDGNIFSFTGLIAIPEAGEVRFRSASDDGSVVWIGGQKVIDNDFYGALPGDSPDGTALFASSGLYPIEIVFYNAGWQDFNGNRGEGIIDFTANGTPVKPEALYPANTIKSALVFPSAAEELRSEKGTGLIGRFWKRQGEPLTGLAGEGMHIINTAPSHGMFKATKLNYSGNERLLLTKWLGDDSTSLIRFHEPEIANVDEALFNFSGLIAIPEAGEVKFRCSSDDGSIIYIGGQKVVGNDGYRAAPGATADGSATFLTPGLYPIEIYYYSGAWRDENGNRGEAIIKFSVNGEDVELKNLYPVIVTR